MICPFCSHPDNRVVDSREVREGAEIRRRRECSDCGRRFTTYERVDELPATVVKRDGSRESFDREKLLTGLLKACEKRPVARRHLVAIVDSVESMMAAREVREMTSEAIGNTVIEELRHLDQVAYVRFASVYRRFEDVHQFIEELRNLLRPVDEGVKERKAKEERRKAKSAKRKRPPPAPEVEDQPRLFEELDEDPPPDQ
jgi:transcriptional repressor NrdR